MTALSADKARQTSGTPITIKAPVNALSVIYEGSLVMYDSTGFAVAASDAASGDIIGVATHAVTGGSSDGDEVVICETGHLERFAASGLADTQNGQIVVVSDDATVTDALAAANDVQVGKLAYLESATVAWVLVGVLGQNAA